VLKENIQELSERLQQRSQHPFMSVFLTTMCTPSVQLCSTASRNVFLKHRIA
jgi:hypothetical protein